MRISSLKPFSFLVFLLFSLSSKAQEKDNTQKYQISVVMPFCTKDLMANPEHKNAAIGNACRKYFEGFVLALDSFKNAELPIEVKVFDTQRDSVVFKKILEKKEILNSDLIIGPVLKEGNELMTSFCKKNKIYHVSPFLTLTKSKIDNPYLISAYPDLTYYSDFILEHIKEGGDDEAHITIISGKDNNDKVLSNRVMALKDKYPAFQFRNLEISKIADFKAGYHAGGANYVVIFSENEFQVGTALKHLGDTTMYTNLEVFGLRKWLEFKSPNIPQMEHLKVKIVSPYFLDYADPANKAFLTRYRDHYYTEADEFAVAGYEQATFFINTLIQNHGSLSGIEKLPRNKPLTNWYRIKQKPDGKSLQNSLLNVLYFEDGKLRRY